MAQVPYRGYPEGGPENVPLRVEPPSALLEGSRALEGFGKEVSGAGDKVWNEAVRLKTLENETEAKEGVIQASKEIGLLHANFSAKEGKERFDAFPQYQKDIEGAYRKVRGGLSNDMSRRMYDGQAVGIATHTIFNGAGQSASAERQWATQTAKSQMELDSMTGWNDPEDEAGFQLSLARQKKNAADLSRLKGGAPDDPSAQLLERKSVENQWTLRIQALTYKRGAEAGQKMLDEQVAARTVGVESQAALQKVIDHQADSKDSVKAADEIFQQNVKSSTLSDMEQMARDRAEKEKPGDAEYRQRVVQGVKSLWRGKNYDEDQQAKANMQTVYAGILKGVKNEEELRLNPATAAAIDALPDHLRLTIPGRITRYNDAKDRQDNAENFYYLKALAREKPEEYSNTDITTYKMSQSQMDYHLGLQMKKKQEGIAKFVSNAMTTLRQSMGPQLDALKVYHYTEKNKKAYINFQGRLQMAIETWQESHDGKLPQPKDITDTIGPQLIQGQAEPRMLFGQPLTYQTPGMAEPAPILGKTTPFFMLQAPPAWKKQKLQDLRDSIPDLDPKSITDQQLNAAYLRERWIQTHGKKQSE